MSRPGAHHPRKPDIGTGIRVFVHCEKAGREIEYYGVYLGHGHAKTVFELQNTSGVFHGKVLEVARERDMEPDVFFTAAERNLTTPILYNALAREGEREYHCWITVRLIPLDEVCQYAWAD